MNKRQVVQRTASFVRRELEGEGTGHDWWHVERVWKNAMKIGRRERADSFVVQLASLLHDVADWKSHHGSESAGPVAARKWLHAAGVDRATISHVERIIRHVSFHGVNKKSMQKTLEGKVVQDADRLDALGAIGIARAFSYGGYKQRPIFNPKVPPHQFRTASEYKRDTIKPKASSTINHFSEKLLLLKDRMNTRTGRLMAVRRHRFVKDFLTQFFREWVGR